MISAPESNHLIKLQQKAMHRTYQQYHWDLEQLKDVLVFSLFDEVLDLFWTGHELQCVLLDTPDVKAQDLRLRVHYLLYTVKLL